MNSIGASLGESQSKALPVFHALSGWDTNSAFNGKGKKSVWQPWQIYDDLTETFVSLVSNPFQLLNLYDEHFQKLERLTVILYDKKVLWAVSMRQEGNCFVRRIEQWTNCHPPRMCYSNLSEAGIRTTSAQTHIGLVFPSPRDLHRPRYQSHGYQFWMTIPQDSRSCTELIKCSCKGDCSNYTCGKANPDCSPLCKMQMYSMQHEERCTAGDIK